MLSTGKVQQDGGGQQLVLRHERLLPRQAMPLQGPQRGPAQAEVRHLQQPLAERLPRGHGASVARVHGDTESHFNGPGFRDVQGERQDRGRGSRQALHREK